MGRTRPALLVSMLSAAWALAAGGSAADNITPAMRSADARLRERVTVHEKSTTVGDLLARIASRTGVKVTADAPDGAAAEKVACFAKDLPLGDLMSGLWSLVSYKGAEWHWERTGKPDAYAYRLMRTMRAQRFPDRVRSRGQEALEHQVDVLIQAADKPDGERAEFLRKYTDDPMLGLDDPALLKGLSADKRQWPVMRVFAAAFPGEQRAAFLRDWGQHDVRLTDMPAFAQTWAQEQATGGPPVMASTGSGPDQTLPSSLVGVRFRVERPGPNTAPVLWVGALVNAGGGPMCSSFAWAGGYPIERALKSWMRSQWMLPGDSADGGTMASRTVGAPAERPDAPAESASPQPVQGEAGDLAQAYAAQQKAARAPLAGFEDLAERVPVPVLVRYGEGDERAPNVTAGQRVADYTRSVQGDAWSPWSCKWRGGVLLISANRWMYRQAP